MLLLSAYPYVHITQINSIIQQLTNNCIQ